MILCLPFLLACFLKGMVITTCLSGRILYMIFLSSKQSSGSLNFSVPSSKLSLCCHFSAGNISKSSTVVACPVAFLIALRADVENPYFDYASNMLTSHLVVMLPIYCQVVLIELDCIDFIWRHWRRTLHILENKGSVF